MESIKYLFLVFYGLASLGLFLYGMNCYVMLWLYFRSSKREARSNEDFLTQFRATKTDADLPRVTTQLPIYNERFVVDRLIRSVVDLDYPRDRHEIQVLDDSTDDTSSLVAALVERYRSEGVNIVQLTREDRSGYKAGALNEGMAVADGEFLAVFDADFAPPPDFLRQTVPFFFEDEKIAMVQTRWGHLNRDYSLLTQAQSVGIDGHFVIEQGARTWQGLFMNFNGTAGIWRKKSILDAGGWQADTLTEDLDLSYRVQLSGWKMKYLANIVTPAEIPVDINGLKSQQHRWAKGSIQTALKVLPQVFRSPVSLFKKMEAVFHLTHYMIHPLMLTVAVFAYPALMLNSHDVSRSLFVVTGSFLILSTFSPSILYLCSQKVAYRDWLRRVMILPALITIGVGIAVNNTKAVIEALTGQESGFVRTPKYGIEGRAGRIDRSDEPGGVQKLGKRGRVYRISPRFTFVLELALGVYGFFTLIQYGLAGKWVVLPFLLINASGFSTVGLLSLVHWWRSQPTEPELLTAP